MLPLRHRLRRSIEKTAPDLLALAAGRLPRFVYGGALDTLPVFTFHVVDRRFEAVLRALRDGGYRTAGADELVAHASGAAADGRTVALTIDDGDASLVRTAVPLLARHGMRAIAFVVSGLVPERTTRRLAGWESLREAVASGVLEVGAHSLHHHHVASGPRVLGIVSRDTPTDFAASIPVPRSLGDERPAIGTPILRGGPRYTVRRAFHPDPASPLRAADRARASAPGRARVVAGRYESEAEADAAVTSDVRDSIALIEARCSNAAARHFCYPWYARDARADRLAALGGATLLYGGVTTRSTPAGSERPALLQRLPPDLLWRLPGPHRRTLGAILAARVASMRPRGHRPAERCDESGRLHS
jgi:peptidoglycan/xylan/chitin deacetylase (PgdA/CDA1 family)